MHGSRRAGPQDGWLVGEAVAQDGALRGTITFYPYANPLLDPRHPEGLDVQVNRRDWRPSRVGP